jgi:thiol-disulfide isomerase/thioredoxin
MQPCKRADLIHIAQALILASILYSGLVRGTWLEEVAPTYSAPALTLKDLQERDYGINDLKGKTVLVNFWTTWCPPCIEEMPSLVRLDAVMKREDFLILAVNVEESKHRVKAISRRLKLPFPVLLDSNRAVGNEWKVRAFPSSFLVDAQGRVRYKSIGPIQWDSDEVISIIRQLIAE